MRFDADVFAWLTGCIPMIIGMQLHPSILTIHDGNRDAIGLAVHTLDLILIELQILIDRKV